MTPDNVHPAGHFDSCSQPDAYKPFYSQERVWDRLSQPSFLLSVVLLLGPIAYHSFRKFRSTEPRETASFSELLWNGLTYLIPASFLFTVDRWLNPPLFPTPMLPTQARTHAAKSEVLRRILGLDRPGGIMRTVSKAGRLSLSSGVWGGQSQPGQPAGLGNWDNSCYQNSILQGLASLQSLPRYLSGPMLDTAEGTSRGDTAQTLRELISELNDARNNGRTLWTPGMLKNMSTWQQQDAQEYFSKLLDEIDKGLAKAVRASQRPAGFETDGARDDTDASQHSDDSGYQSLSHSFKAEANFDGNPLEGLIAQRVACVACGYSEGLSMIPFNCLTLNMGIDRTQYDLYERLDNYARVESIQGVECPKCTLLKFQRLINIIIDRGRAAGVTDEDLAGPLARLQVIEAALGEEDFDDETLAVACKIPSTQRVSSTKTKQAVIARPPRSLAVHMNRSVFDEMTGQMFKNSAAVRFPLTLDLGPWCLGSADESTFDGREDKPEERQETAKEEEERWLLDATSSMIAGDLHSSKITGPMYELRAVITHYGRHENGHYVCYRKHRAQQPPNLEGKGPQESVEDEPPPLLPFEEGQQAEQRPDAPSLGPTALDLEEALQRKDSLGDDVDGQWWRLSDQDVTRSSEEDVLGQGGVFMLFYDCVDPQSTWTGDDSQPFHDAQAPGAGDQQSGFGVGIANDSVLRSEDGPPHKQALTAVGDDILSRAAAVPLPAGDDEEDLKPEGV